MLLWDDTGYLGKVNKSHFGQIFGDVWLFFWYSGGTLLFL